MLASYWSLFVAVGLVFFKFAIKDHSGLSEAFIVVATGWNVMQHAVATRIAAEEARDSAEESIAHATAAAENSVQVAIALAQKDDEEPKRRHL